ncbi:MAG TPA: hypothetical protein VGK73_13085 [Polyangiaceae bacterium]
MPNIRNSPSGKLIPTDGLPEGSYTGQPVVWNGAEYVPTDPDFASRRFRIREIRDVSGQEGNALGIIASNDVGISINSNHAGDTNRIELLAGNSSGSNGVLDLRRLVCSLSLDAFQIMAASGENSAAEIGFLGATPAPRQSITGTTEQEQIDSIVTALVNLGLVTDDR